MQRERACVRVWDCGAALDRPCGCNSHLGQWQEGECHEMLTAFGFRLCLSQFSH